MLCGHLFLVMMWRYLLHNFPTYSPKLCLWVRGKYCFALRSSRHSELLVPCERHAIRPHRAFSTFINLQLRREAAAERKGRPDDTISRGDTKRKKVINVKK